MIGKLADVSKMVRTIQRSVLNVSYVNPWTTIRSGGRILKCNYSVQLASDATAQAASAHNAVSNGGYLGLALKLVPVHHPPLLLRSSTGLLFNCSVWSGEHARCLLRGNLIFRNKQSAYVRVPPRSRKLEHCMFLIRKLKSLKSRSHTSFTTKP